MKIQLTTLFIALAFLSCNDPDKSTQGQIQNVSTDRSAAKDTAAKNTAVNDLTPEKTVVPNDTAVIGAQEAISEEQMNKAEVSKKDSLIRLSSNMRLDHRIFGYEKPDTNSKKMILLSIFTSDVKGNPYKCPYGSFYETNEMAALKLKFVLDAGDFIAATVKKNDAILGRVFIDKKWIEFEELK